MNTSPSVRAYRRLGYVALAHAVVLVGLAVLSLNNWGSTDAGGDWLLRLWVALVTLWFLWPLVLALQRGRSVLRFALFVFVGSALLWPSLRFYDFLAPDVFGLPGGMKMNPVSVWKYSSAYLAGRSQARNDLSAGILAIEDAALIPGHERWDGQVLRERYQIEIRTIAGQVVDERSIGHQAGYNSVSIREIDRRFGWDRVQAARGEALQERYER